METTVNTDTKIPVYIVSLNNIPFLPYIYGLLRSYAEQHDLLNKHYEFKEPFFYSFKSPKEIVREIHGPAVVGLSTYIWNFSRNMKIAKLVKSKYPDSLIIAGGPQIPDNADGFLEQHSYIDVLVHGEGEEVFSQLLLANLQSEENWDNIPGISFRSTRNGVVTTTRTSLELEHAPLSPYLAGHLDNAMTVFEQNNIRYYAAWETNRGCPFSCTFCDWGSSTMSKVRNFDLERLYSEIDYFATKKVPNVHINDANFGMLKRDISLATYIRDTKEKHQFPDKIYLNFAKNSNDRVFEISRIWYQSDLLENTTLSMQATNDHVLQAIKRKNIPIEQYEALQARYIKENMHTYTEVILGLPEETCQSFKTGLDRILEAGNHEDVRIYELTILPNAPMANPQMREKYGLVTVDKEILPRRPGVSIEEDEIETIPTVIETNTMSTKDWIDCSLYARMLQCIHSGALTRYLAIYFNREHNMPFHVFYIGMQRYFFKHPKSVLGRVLYTLYDYYLRYTQQKEIPQIKFSLVSKSAIELLSVCNGFLQIHDQFWLCIIPELEKFYSEISEYTLTLKIDIDVEQLKDLLLFQKEMIFSPEYNPDDGKQVIYEYNWINYFLKNTLLEKNTVGIKYTDNKMGGNILTLTGYKDIATYVNSIVPTSALSNTKGNYYQHRLDKMHIVSQSSCLELEAG